jgi:hypothetical protein
VERNGSHSDCRVSVGLILKEGLPLDTLRRVVSSMHAAAAVVDRGKADETMVESDCAPLAAPILARIERRLSHTAPAARRLIRRSRLYDGPRLPVPRVL